MQLLLTILGTGNYHPCRYRFHDTCSDEQTHFCLALADYIKPDLVITLETDRAAQTHGSVVAQSLKRAGFDHQSKSIPDGSSESELWEIFSALAEVVPEGSTLHLDITHGFRSLPLLGFLALSYLRVTRKVTIGGLHYGAWEARDESTNIAPSFDLTAFVTLLEWTSAADQFITSGNATRLADLLQQTQQSLWQDAGENDRSGLPRTLKRLASALRESSTALLTLRTGDLQSTHQKLTQELEQAHEEASTFARPFLEVLTPVQEELNNFPNGDLATLSALIEWLAARGHSAAALTLACEWLTSYAMEYTGISAKGSTHKKRLPFSDAIWLLETNDESASVSEEVLLLTKKLNKNLPAEALEALRKLSSTVRNARNDINHAGYIETPANASTLSNRAAEVAATIKNLPLP